MKLVEGLRLLIGEAMTPEARQAALWELNHSHNVSARMYGALRDAEAKLPPDETAALPPEAALQVVVLLATSLQLQVDSLMGLHNQARRSVEVLTAKLEARRDAIHALAQTQTRYTGKVSADGQVEGPLAKVVEEARTEVASMIHARTKDAVNDERRRVERLVAEHFDLANVSEPVARFLAALAAKPAEEVLQETFWEQMTRSSRLSRDLNDVPPALVMTPDGARMLVKWPEPATFVSIPLVPDAEDPDHE